MKKALILGAVAAVGAAIAVTRGRSHQDGPAVLSQAADRLAGSIAEKASAAAVTVDHHVQGAAVKAESVLGDKASPVKKLAETTSEIADAAARKTSDAAAEVADEVSELAKEVADGKSDDSSNSENGADDISNGGKGASDAK